MSAFRLPGGWDQQLRARLELDGWRAAASPTRSPTTTAAKATSAGLVVVLNLVSYAWPRPGALRVTVESGVGVEAAMDLAAHLGWPAHCGAFFARDPDRLPEQTACQGGDGAEVCEQVSRAADAAFTDRGTRFRSATELDTAMAVQPRVLRTDLVMQRVFLLAATGNLGSAFDVLRAAVEQLDDGERHDRGWRPAAAHLRTELTAWSDRGSPPPPSWWSS